MNLFKYLITLSLLATLSCDQPDANDKDVSQITQALTTPLIAKGSTFRYLADGSNQGTAWQAAGFNDSGWASGRGQLGYGDGDEATVIGYGGNASAKYITTYFRTTFSVVNPGSFTSLSLGLLRDDGAVAYLNGTEIFRSNMPAGTIGHTTVASSTVEDNSYFTATVSAALLVAGTNVIAVEVHQSGGTSSDLSMDLELVGTNASSAVTVTRGPYLQRGTSTGGVVRFRSSAAVVGRVRFGASIDALSSQTDGPATATTEHEIALSGLTPNTKYFYSVGSTAAALGGGDANHFFFTAPTPGTPKPTRLWILGDSGTANSSAQSVRDGYLSYAGTRYTDLVLMLGDNAYTTGTDTEHQAAVFNMYPSVLRQSFLFPVIGNHETAQATTAAATLPYFNIFTLPKSAEAGGIASGTEQYYSFDFGDTHFVALDSMASDRAAGAAMATWLSNDLAANMRKWLMAFWHHPPYSRGTHKSDTEIELRQMRENIVPLLDTYGADLVLSGHSHGYERSFLIDGVYNTPTTVTPANLKNSGSGRTDGTGAYAKAGATAPASARQGAVYVVAGSSGQITSPAPTYGHPAMYISLNNLGSVVVDIDGDRLDAKFLRESGATPQVADWFTITHGAAVSPPPPTPNAAPTVSITAPANATVYTAPATVTIEANATDSDGTIAKVDFYQGTALLGTDTTAPYSFSWTSVAAGTYSLTARAVDNANATTTSTAVSITVTAAPAATLIPAKATGWKYYTGADAPADQNAASWTTLAFSDANWAQGAAELGYGDGGEATVIPSGGTTKWISSYFRKSFNVTNPADYPQLTINMTRDDGGVVYLNGTEIFRSNMPTGTISYSTLAASTIGGTDESAVYSKTITNAASLLVPGTNVIAVEVHQVNATSSDISFDLELKK